MLLQTETIERELKKLLVIFPTNLAAAEMLEVWFEGLRDLPDAAVAQGFQHIRRTHKPKFNGDFPTPSMVRDFVISLIGGSWEKALLECIINAYRTAEPIKTTGPDGKLVDLPVVFSSEFLRRVYLDLGGYGYFRDADGNNPAVRAQFRDAYNKLRDRCQSTGDLRLMLQAPKQQAQPLQLTPALCERPEVDPAKTQNIIKFLRKKHGDSANATDVIGCAAEILAGRDLMNERQA